MTFTDEFVAPTTGTPRARSPAPSRCRPARKVAVLACMDARLDPAKVFGFAEGDAHVIRDAGGAVIADAERSLAISQPAGPSPTWRPTSSSHSAACGRRPSFRTGSRSAASSTTSRPEPSSR